MGDGWKAARLRDVPPAAELRGFSREEYLEGMREQTHAVRGFLGVASFGVNAFEAHAGELLVVPHDELGPGEQQEELYLVVEGRARFVCDGETVELGPASCSTRAPASAARRSRSRRRRCSSWSAGAQARRTRRRSGRTTGAGIPSVATHATSRNGVSNRWYVGSARRSSVSSVTPASRAVAATTAS